MNTKAQNTYEQNRVFIIAFQDLEFSQTIEHKITKKHFMNNDTGCSFAFCATTSLMFNNIIAAN